jgi:hypothetical protein
MQKSASLSTAEEEWYAASEAGKEIIGLHSILFDFWIRARWHHEAAQRFKGRDCHD